MEFGYNNPADPDEIPSTAEHVWSILHQRSHSWPKTVDLADESKPTVEVVRLRQIDSWLLCVIVRGMFVTKETVRAPAEKNPRLWLKKIIYVWDMIFKFSIISNIPPRWNLAIII